MFCSMCQHGVSASKCWLHCGRYLCNHIGKCPKCGISRADSKRNDKTLTTNWNQETIKAVGRLMRPR